MWSHISDESLCVAMILYMDASIIYKATLFGYGQLPCIVYVYMALEFVVYTTLVVTLPTSLQ